MTTTTLVKMEVNLAIGKAQSQRGYTNKCKGTAANTSGRTTKQLAKQCTTRSCLCKVKEFPHGQAMPEIEGSGDTPQWKSYNSWLAMVIMGVSGSGKSTIGNLLANSLGCTFLDADDFHSAENKEKMKQGIPLTDSDRLPWLETLRDKLIDYILWGKMVILACSALKPSYRCILRTADFEWMLEKQEKDQGNLVSKEFSDQGLEEICQLNMRTKSTPELSEELSNQPSKRNGQLKANTQSLPSLHRVQFFLLNGPIELFASRLECRFKKRAHFMPPSLLQSQMDSLNIGKNEEDIIFLDGSMSPEAIVIQIKELVCHKG